MRDKKSFLFHNDSGAEKNTVQALLKALQDTQDSVSVDLLETATGVESSEWGTDLQFEFRTEVTESNPQGEPRYLVGLSTDDKVLAGNPTGRDGRIDARIRISDGDERTATIFIEAKVGANTLQEGQLRDYVDEFDITETAGEKAWTTVQWADVYTIFREHIDSRSVNADSRHKAEVNNYLLTEFSDWLQHKNLIQHRVGDGTQSENHIKHLNVGINDEDEYYLQISAETHEDRNQSGTATITEPVWERFLEEIDEEIRRETFGVPTESEPDPTPDLSVLREWLLSEQGYNEGDFEGTGRRWVWEIEAPDYPLKIKFRSDYNLWVRTKPNVHYCPVLNPEEFRDAFEGISPENRESVFVDGDLSGIWKSAK